MAAGKLLIQCFKVHLKRAVKLSFEMLARKTAMNIIKNIKNRESGQTLIETTFVLLLLLLILFGIAEFARAWFLKNSLNNAARVGARFAVVQVDLVPNDAAVIAAVKNAPGVPSDNQSSQIVLVEVFICDKDESDCDSAGASESEANTGDIIRITVTVTFKDSNNEDTQFSVLSSLIPGLSGPDALQSLSARASMRYEL